ncbi:MAG: hypothetical protein Q4F56_03410, partial [Candidatus Saccharibacteria bacterium]|nr:hypothetical protein [Candidatus Saccharibacteria bacterium]
LVDKVTDPSRTVVLSATYFGNEPSYQHIEALEDLQKRGVRVIEDETHRVLGDLAPMGDVALASLRKTLPVADGAYIRGSLKLEPHSTLSHSGWRAMDEKLAGNHQKARVLFTETSRHLKESITQPSSPDLRTMETISTLNYEVLRERRRSNSAWLRERLLDLPGIDTVNAAVVPSHLVIQVEGAQQVQKKLSQAGIYCPIHWPRPERLKNIKWRDDLLSLPIDHRYDINDMQRIAEKIQIIVEG